MRNFFLDSSDEATLNLLRTANAAVLIFGAGPLGRQTLAAARQLGIGVAAFCDNSPAKQGTTIDGLPVLTPEAAARRYPEAYYFVAFFVVMAAIPELRRRNLGGRCLTLDIIPRVNPELSGMPDNVALVIRQTCSIQKSLRGDGGIYLGRLSLLVTEYCSLRCRDCNNRIPYIPNPRHRDTRSVLGMLDKFLSFVDGVQELHLVGGDAMLYPDLAFVTREVLLREKVSKVGIYTNGILPFSGEQWLGLPPDRVTFHVTDYEIPRQNLAAFSAGLAKFGFPLCTVKKETWQRFEIRYRPDDDTPENRGRLARCRISVCPKLDNNRLYRCPLVPNAVREAKIPDDPDNYIDLFAEIDAQSARERIRHFLFGKADMAACAACTAVIPGVSADVEPAIQLP